MLRRPALASIHLHKSFLGGESSPTRDRESSITSHIQPSTFHNPHPQSPSSEKLAAIAARPSGSLAGSAVYGFAVLPTLGKTAPKSSNPWKKTFQCSEKVGVQAQPASKVWKNPAGFFQPLEKQTQILPTLGNFGPVFSNLWKTDARFFQCSEKLIEKFPTSGKKPPDFSPQSEAIDNFAESKIVTAGNGSPLENKKENIPAVGKTIFFMDERFQRVEKICGANAVAIAPFL